MNQSSPVAGILLAAGAGTRMGTPKGLLRTPNGTAWVTRAVAALAAGGCAPILVVIGAQAEHVQALVPKLAQTVVAVDWQEGMGASLRAGLQALTERAPASVAVVITLVDSQGQGIYEWSVTPAVRDLMAGERATFDTSLPLPPGDAVKVRLSFGGGRTPTNVSEPPAEHAPPSAADGHADPTAEYDEAVSHEEAPAGEGHDAPAAADHGAAAEPSHSPVEAAAPAVHH